MQIERIAISKIKPYEKNAKRHTDEQIQHIINSIEQCGMNDPIGIWGEKNVIVEGHGRYFALKKMGVKEVDCIRLDHLSDEERKAYTLVHNQATLETPFDDDLLKIELDGIFDIDMSELGFDLDFDINEEPTEIVEDEVPEEVETRCKLGDIWQLGNHRLICGDSTDPAVIDRLMNGVKADMVFTDPPYGMHLDTDYSGMQGNGRKGKKYDKVIGDNDDFSPRLITSIFESFDCEEIFLWGVDYYFDLIPNFKDGSLSVWDKTLQSNGDADYNSEFELLWSKNPHKKEVIHFNWFRFFGLSSQDIKTRSHPTQKPLQVISPFIKRYSKENDVIVDVFGGSGSTLIACEQLNRKCYMCELDPHYCDVIISRYENFTGKAAVKVS